MCERVPEEGVFKVWSRREDEPKSVKAAEGWSLEDEPKSVKAAEGWSLVTGG